VLAWQQIGFIDIAEMSSRLLFFLIIIYSVEEEPREEGDSLQ
jgi:hypothetical protein